jgi:Na+-translocating ferredoxin:NAD+ oxidoreductase RnfA subunit
MLTPFSIPLLAALLLAIQIIAPAINLRTPKNLNEAFGLGATTGITLLITIILHWPLAHLVLQPFGLQFLGILVAVPIIATSAALIETALRNRLPNYFPVDGTFQPQIVAGAFILALPLIQGVSLTFGDALVRAALFAVGAKLLIGAFHAAREHSANARIPVSLRGPAIDFISAGLLVAALGGIASVF